MHAYAVAARRHRLELKSVNVDDLLNHLLARGIAREIVPKAQLTRAVRINNIEFAITSKPKEQNMRARWKERVKNKNFSCLLIADDPEHPLSALTLGPNTHEEPIRSVDCARLAKAIERAASMSEFDALRHLAREVIRLGSRGKIVNGLLTNHAFETRFRDDLATWNSARKAIDGLTIDGNWRSVISGFGYEIEQLPIRGYIARFGGQSVAMIHPRANPQDFIRLDEMGRPTEGVLASDCHKHNVRYGILACRNRYRLFDCDPSATTAEWLDLDAELLEEADLPYLALLSPKYLAEGGLLALQADAKAFGAELRQRLDRTIRQEALPALAEGLEHWANNHSFDLANDDKRSELEKAALTLLFRLMFVEYAESSSYLPTENPTYRVHSLSQLVDEAHTTKRKLSKDSTSLWSSFKTLIEALRRGNPAWGVPAYNGALFAPTDFEGAELLERMELADPHFAKVLLAVGRDSETGVGVDYSSLEVGHLGHIYEALLSLRLSLAARGLRYDAGKDRYIPDERQPDVRAGSLLWQTNEGGRKAGGVYYTPSTLVEHLVRKAVLPAFERHLEEVKSIAITDPALAAHKLLSFSVLDPSCGSAHFLVLVTEALADRTVEFLAERPLPVIRERLDRLRKQILRGSEIADVALLRRLILKHCVFGVDLSPMGAEIATVSLWLSSFVPGLSLTYLDRNVIVGNSLIGVADAKAIAPEGELIEHLLKAALNQAADAASRLADIDDIAPDEVQASKAADDEARQATEGMERLFNLWTAGGFNLEGARNHVRDHGLDVIDGTGKGNNVGLNQRASELAERHSFLHWALRFPQVFFRERPGFDVVVGNPPWEEVTVEELSFFGLYFPGIQSLSEAERSSAVADLIAERPELKVELEFRQHKVQQERIALASGEYYSTKGDPDLSKYFCQRYQALVRDGGFFGVVLPRSVFVNQGSEGFRKWLYTQMSAQRIDFLKNKQSWMFGTTPQYGIALLSANRHPPKKDHRVTIAGIADSPKKWNRQSASPGILIAPSTFASGWITPRIRSQEEANLLTKIRLGSPFPSGSAGRWKCFPVAEFHETNDRHLWRNATKGSPLWKGESFDQYDPHGSGMRYCQTSKAASKKVRKSRPGLKSMLANSISTSKRQQAVETELKRARIAFRDVARATDRRTVISCLIPPKTFLTNKAPYLAFVGGSEVEQAACLGIMNSLPFDWQLRRFVEINLSFFLLEALVVPDLTMEDFLKIAQAAARLSAADQRFADFASATGVECGPLSDEERQRLRVEIDARVARAWKLTTTELGTIFKDFTTNAVPPAYRDALVKRFCELA